MLTAENANAFKMDLVMYMATPPPAPIELVFCEVTDLGVAKGLSVEG